MDVGVGFKPGVDNKILFIFSLVYFLRLVNEPTLVEI